MSPSPGAVPGRRSARHDLPFSAAQGMTFTSRGQPSLRTSLWANETHLAAMLAEALSSRDGHAGGRGKDGALAVVT
jgi:hypothetical protein